MSGNTTQFVSNQLDRLRQGDEGARGALIAGAAKRMQLLTQKMFRDYPRLERWTEADDVYQQAIIRLHRSLADLRPESSLDFFRLAALQIRRELKDLARHYFGPEGIGRNHASQIRVNADSTVASLPIQPDDTLNPEVLARWSDFHAAVEKLPDEQRQAFDLLWYHEISQAEAAEVMGVSERQVRRYWQSARITLQERLRDSGSAF